MGQIIKVGDVVRIKNEDINNRIGVVAGSQGHLVEVECRNDGEPALYLAKVKELTMVRSSNMVHSIMNWANGVQTERMFDLSNHLERVAFASLANKCYLENGSVTVTGCNKTVAEMP